jgi:hypothetical protein
MGMKHSDEWVALQVVEFWTTVCEEEIELTHEAQEVRGMHKYYSNQSRILQAAEYDEPN